MKDTADLDIDLRPQRIGLLEGEISAAELRETFLFLLKVPQDVLPGRRDFRSVPMHLAKVQTALQTGDALRQIEPTVAVLALITAIGFALGDQLTDPPTRQL